MHIAASLLEDKSYLRSFLEKARATLLKSRLLAESLLSEAGVDFHAGGYVFPIRIRSSKHAVDASKCRA